MLADQIAAQEEATKQHEKDRGLHHVATNKLRKEHCAAALISSVAPVLNYMYANRRLIFAIFFSRAGVATFGTHTTSRVEGMHDRVKERQKGGYVFVPS